MAFVMLPQDCIELLIEQQQCRLEVSNVEQL